MITNLLGTSKQLYHSKLNNKKAVAILVAVLLVASNVLFLALRTDENHTLMLVLSIVFSVLLGWFLVAYVSLKIQPMQNLYNLYARRSQKVQVTIEKIEQITERVDGFDCFKVHTQGRVFFLVDGCAITLQEGENVTLHVATNIITEVER